MAPESGPEIGTAEMLNFVVASNKKRYESAANVEPEPQKSCLTRRRHAQTPAKRCFRA